MRIILVKNISKLEYFYIRLFKTLWCYCAVYYWCCIPYVIISVTRFFFSFRKTNKNNLLIKKQFPICPLFSQKKINKSKKIVTVSTGLPHLSPVSTILYRSYLPNELVYLLFIQYCVNQACVPFE